MSVLKFSNFRIYFLTKTNWITLLGTSLFDTSFYKISLLPLESIVILAVTLIVIKGGINSIFGYILFILLLSYFLIKTQLFVYAFLFLLLSVVVMIMLSVVMSVTPISTSNKAGSFLFKSSIAAIVCFLFLTSKGMGHVYASSSSFTLFQEDFSLTAPTYLSGNIFVLDNLLFVVWFIFIATSCFFIWVKISPQFIQFTFNLGAITKKTLVEQQKRYSSLFSFFSAFSIDLSFLFILGVILFALPGAIKNYFARTSLSDNSVYLLRASRWREELERWSADVYECGISADVIQLKNNPNFLRFIILAGFFILLDIEVIFIAFVFLSSNTTIISLLISTALIKWLALMNIMSNR